MSSSGNNQMPRPTLAKIMAGNVNNAEAALELNRRRQLFKDVPHLPFYLREGGDLIFQKALSNECPAEFEALRTGTCEVERPIVLILQHVIGEIDELMHKWDDKKTAWFQQLENNKKFVLIEDWCEKDSNRIRTYTLTAMSKRRYITWIKQVDGSDHLLLDSEDLPDSGRAEDAMDFDSAHDPNSGASRMHQQNAALSPGDGVPAAEEPQAQHPDASPRPKKRRRVEEENVVPERSPRPARTRKLTKKAQEELANQQVVETKEEKQPVSIPNNAGIPTEHYPKAPALPTPALLREPKRKLTLKIPGRIWNSVTPEPAQQAPAEVSKAEERANVLKLAIPGAKLADWETRRANDSAEQSEEPKPKVKGKGSRKVVGKDASKPKASPLTKAAPKSHPARTSTPPAAAFIPRRRPRNVHHELTVKLRARVPTSLFPAAEGTHVSTPRPQESTLDRDRCLKRRRGEAEEDPD